MREDCSPVKIGKGSRKHKLNLKNMVNESDSDTERQVRLIMQDYISIQNLKSLEIRTIKLQCIMSYIMLVCYMLLSYSWLKIISKIMCKVHILSGNFDCVKFAARTSYNTETEDCIQKCWTFKAVNLSG